MAAEPTNNHKPMLERRKTLHPDVVAANEALTLSLIRQQQLTEAAEMGRAELEAEIVARKRPGAVGQQTNCGEAWWSRPGSLVYKGPASGDNFLCCSARQYGTGRRISHPASHADGALRRVNRHR